MSAPQWLRRFAVPFANKIVYASDAYVDLKSNLIQLSPQLIDFGRSPCGDADERLLTFARLIKPMTGSNLRKVRVGSQFDGGYVMADDFGARGAISVGIGSDVSWDLAIAKREIPVAMFDPTIRRLPEKVPGGRLIRTGLGDESSTAPYAPLSSLVQIAGFSPSDSLLLKIDIEGNEYSALQGVSDQDLMVYRQITIELHDLGSLSNADRGKLMISAVRKLTAHHFPIHVHGNNYDSLVRFGNLWFANAIELTLLRKDLITNARPALRVREACDHPCDPRVPDISLEALITL